MSAQQSEQCKQAIRLYLSMPAPYYDACCCMGKMPITQETAEPYTIKLVAGFHKVNAIKVIRTELNASLKTALRILAAPLEFKVYEDAKHLLDRFIAAGVKAELNKTKQYYPVCPCKMQEVVELDGRFYKITEHRSPDGITHTADDIGPIGGPYTI
jgi:ribosomal protein L7/L12